MQDNKTLHIYTRVSTTAQEEKGTSLETQEALGIKAAKSLGVGYKVWNEGGRSSNYEDLNNRPKIMELLRSIEAGEVKNL
jgi:DNA invertase Pin-like site-specific DNA recombinase